jgi:hypothetical protein
MMMIVNYMMLVIMMLIVDYVDITYLYRLYILKVMKVVKQDGILVKIGGRNVIIILLKIKYLG